MSVIALHVSRRRAIVVVDTATSELDGANPGAATKLFCLPHVGAVIATRGLMAFCSGVAGALNAQCRPTFDELRAAMPATIAGVRDAVASSVHDIGAEFVVVGPSAAHGALMAHHFRLEHGRLDSAEYCGSGTLYLPGEAGWGLDRTADSPGRLLAQARRQVGIVRQMGPGRTGGAFIIAELAADSIAMRRVPE